MAWKAAQVSGETRDDLVAAVAAEDVIGLSKAEARAAKEEVVQGILGDDHVLSGKALSGLFMEAGRANGGPRLFFPLFFASPRLPKAPAPLWPSASHTRRAPSCCTRRLGSCLRQGLEGRAPQRQGARRFGGSRGR